ncbi:MAG: beta strand repeat-containing protein [Janthinobacterium lividum]
MVSGLTASLALANPLLTGGGGAVSFPATGTHTTTSFQGYGWEVANPAGTVIASSGSQGTNGWSESSSGGNGSAVTFTLQAPASASIGTGYELRQSVPVSGFPASAFFDVAAPPIPVAPTGLSAAAGNQSVSLTWTAVSGAASYSVYRGTTGGGESATAVAMGLTSPSDTDTGLTNGTAYYYVVKAVNSSGTSPVSNEASAVPVPALSGVSLTASGITGGSPVTGTVTLTTTTASSVTVALSSSNTTVATVPSTVTIPAGQASATFTVSTNAVNSAASVTISAVSGSVTKTATLTVNPWIASLVLNPTSVIGALTNGTQSTGTVTLSSAAPAGGAVVNLTSSNTSLVTLPSSVTVPAGTTTNTFSVTASNVTSGSTATLSAAYNGTTLTAVLTVNPWLKSYTLAPSSLIGGGTATATGTITLNANAPTGGLPVTLASSSPSATVPATVTVAAGSTTATFTVTTQVVTAYTNAQITASYSNLSLPQNLTLLPLLSSITLSPYSLTGGSPSTGTVTLNAAAPAGGAAIALSSSNAAATVPASVTVAAGSTTGTFTVTTGAVTTVTTASISASYAGATPSPQSLTINPIQVTVAVNPTSVLGGSSSTGTVTLNGPAPAGGLVVTLSSSNSAATVPASVTVAAGSTTATFTVTTTSVTSSSNATITAAYGGLSNYAYLTLLPVLKSVSMSPSSLIAGNPSTGTVTLNAVAPAGGTVVALSSSSTAATVPASVTVAAGSTTATFTATTTNVTSTTYVTITAANASASTTASLYIQPLLSYLSLSPTSVNGGTSSTGTISLSAAAPTGGAVITLASSNTAAATTPSTVTVPAGSNSVTFTVTTLTVSANATASISAAYGGVTLSQTLTVTPVPPLLASVSLSTTRAASGSTVTGTVSLSQAAPAGGITVTLASDTTATATVPASLAIAAGATSATFTVTTGNVTVSSTATISATYSGTTRSASLLTVVPLLSSVSLNPATIVGGDPSTATANFNIQAPAGATLTLSSSNTAVATVPATVSVPTGSYSVPFSVSSVSVTTATTVTISAAYGGVIQTATLTVNPMPTVTRLSVSPGEVTGGSSSYGTVALSGIAPASGSLVTLSSGSGSATVPATVTVPSGQSSTGFSIGTSPVAATTTVTLSGTYRSATVPTTLIIDRPALTRFSFSPASLNGGNGTTGTLTLSGPAPTGGVTFSMTCAPASGAGFSSSVTVPAGATSVPFPAATSTVNTPVTLVFTATNTVSGGESLSANVNLTLGTLHATDLLFPKAIQLQWSLSAVGNFLLYRDGVLIATLPNSAVSYIDTFNWNSGQTYKYDIKDSQTSPATLLSTEQTVPYIVPAIQDQAVDSRLDPRYAANVFLDHQFGSTSYRGGLFVGYDTDPSRIGRSFAQFNLTPPLTGAVYRTGRVNAYFITGDTTNGVINMTVGCQALTNNTWNASTLTWDTALTAFNLVPTAAPQTTLIQYDPSTPGSVSASGGIRQIILSWGPPVTTKTIVSYTVSYGTSSGNYPNQVTGILPTPAGNGSTTITGLTNTMTYYFAVQAVYSDGTTSNNSLPVIATPPNVGGSVTPPNMWYSWPLASDILNALQGSNVLSVGWASMNETQQGWAYFAKTEYDPTLGPCVTHLWSIPTLVNLQVPGTVTLNGASSTTATGLLTVNAIGLQGSATVTLVSSNPAVVSVPASLMVNGLTRSFNMAVSQPASNTSVVITATLGPIQKQMTMIVNR